MFRFLVKTLMTLHHDFLKIYAWEGKKTKALSTCLERTEVNEAL